jgi:hypothetical protein
MKKIILLATLSLSLSACGQMEGAEEIVSKPVETIATQTPCQDEEFRQLDFWVGEWDLEWDVTDGKPGRGTNIITKTPFGDCVITENFDGAPTQQFKGMSVSTYHKPAGVWRQTWVDDQGGYFALSGGSQEDGTFKLDMTRLKETATYRRMVWKDIKTDSLTWYWQGHGLSETEWKDLWVIRYTRKATP